ncbi:hypothetical protein NDU88_004959 [Pleurodeles waltl]|uniref:Centromere protein K n=1 Tax=Pleurodeles waltl TaxID=8319 RepID=A0AAV7W6G2_PLEWA|nr:hypothetical protein NDU88_004959 [Pleurodeles waltl]
MDKQEELLKDAESLAKHMSSYNCDLAPDLISESDCSAEAKEQLLVQCENIWVQMEKCQSKLNQLGTETLPETDTQLFLLMMQVKSLMAECTQWQKKEPEIISANQEVLLTLGKQELQKVNRELEMVLSSVRSKNRKLKEELKMEQRWLEEQQQLVQALSSRQEELKNHVVQISEKRVCREVEQKIIKIRAYEQELLGALGEFLGEHFPLPEKPEETSKKKKILPAGPATQLKTLHDILEELMNKLLATPHDPYVPITESDWPPYIELLLRYGIALRHPQDPNRIRLEAFHH